MLQATISAKGKVSPWLNCYVCGDKNPLDVPRDVIANHSSSHPVCMIRSQKEYRPRLRRKSLKLQKLTWADFTMGVI